MKEEGSKYFSSSQNIPFYLIVEPRREYVLSSLEEAWKEAKTSERKILSMPSPWIYFVGILASH